MPEVQRLSVARPYYSIMSWVVACCLAMGLGHAATAPDLNDGIYSTAQAGAGARLYARECAQCHGPDLEGGEAAAALRGAAFRRRWAGRSLAELHELTRTRMPLTSPGSLADAQYLELLAFVLHRNGFPPGKTLLGDPRTPLAGLRMIEPAAKANELPLPSLERPLEMTEWLHHRGNPGSQNYSPLSLINAGNVDRLQVLWRWRSDNFGPTPFPNLEATPLMAGGVLYATAGSRRDVVAIDARTGETLWMYRLDEGRRGETAPRKGPGRGVAYWRDAHEARVLFITPGYQLVALNASNGRPIDGFGTGGIVDLKTSLGQDIDLDGANLGSSSPPLVIGDVVIVGAAFAGGGAPPTKEMPAGDVTAFDVRTGKRLWVFHTIPRPGETGHDTWLDGSWRYTGNTGVWAPMSADPDLGYIYLPVEESTGDFYGGHRPGDNLFSQSLVCLEARTGKRVWHFQILHHGLWDYDLPAPPVLVDVTHGNRRIPAVAQVTKQGFVFVFDRRNGEPLWPIEERPVPPSDVPGERSSPTQPFPTLPVPFIDQGVQPGTLNDLTPEIHREALRIIANARSGPLYTPPSVVTDSNRGTLMAPAAPGGANWQGAVVDPVNQILFVSATNTIGLAGLTRDPERSNMRYVFVSENWKPEGPFGLPLARPPWGRITAIDLRTGRHLWMMANGDTPERIASHPKLQAIQLPRTGHNDRAGLLVTATLLFAGEGAGLFVADEGGTKFRAHDKLSGRIVAEVDLGARQSGLPMTYAIDGRQYIVVAVGAPNHAGEFVALGLPNGD